MIAYKYNESYRNLTQNTSAMSSIIQFSPSSGGQGWYTGARIGVVRVTREILLALRVERESIPWEFRKMGRITRSLQALLSLLVVFGTVWTAKGKL